MLRGLGSLERSIAALLLLVFFSAIGNGMVSVVLQPYLKHLGLGSREVGLLQFAASLATSVALVPSAYMADRFGRRRVAIASLAFSFPGFLIVVFTGSVEALAAGFGLLGLGNALASVSLNPLLADVTPRERLDLVSSVSQVLGLAGSSIGLALSWIPQLVAGSTGSLLHAYRSFMFCGGMISVIGFPLLLLVREPGAAGGRFRLGFSREALLLSALSAITALGAGASVWLINYYFASKFSVEAGELGTRMLAETLLMIPLTSLAPILSRRLGTLRAVIALQLSSIPLLALTALAPSFPLAAAVFTLRSALMNAGNPLMWSLSMKLVGEDERSRYTMLNTLAWQLAGGVGSAIGGWLMSANLDSPLYFTASLYLLQVLLLYRLFGTREGSSRQRTLT
jgi:MFS family permease